MGDLAGFSNLSVALLGPILPPRSKMRRWRSSRWRATWRTGIIACSGRLHQTVIGKKNVTFGLI